MSRRSVSRRSVACLPRTLSTAGGACLRCGTQSAVVHPAERSELAPADGVCCGPRLRMDSPKPERGRFAGAGEQPWGDNVVAFVVLPLTICRTGQEPSSKLKVNAWHIGTPGKRYRRLPPSLPRKAATSRPGRPGIPVIPRSFEIKQATCPGEGPTSHPPVTGPGRESSPPIVVPNDPKLPAPSQLRLAGRGLADRCSGRGLFILRAMSPIGSVRANPWNLFN